MEFLRKKEALSYFTKRSNNKDIVLLAKDINELGSKKFLVTHKKKLFKSIKAIVFAYVIAHNRIFMFFLVFFC